MKTKPLVSRFWTFCYLGLFRFFFLSCEIQCGNPNRDIKHMPVAYKISKIIVQVLTRGYTRTLPGARLVSRGGTPSTRALVSIPSLATGWTLLAESGIQLAGLGARVVVRRQWVAQVQLFLAFSGARQAHERAEQDDRTDRSKGAGHRSMGHRWQLHRQLQQGTHLRG